MQVEDLGTITHCSTLVNKGCDTTCFICRKPLVAGDCVRTRGTCHWTFIRKKYIFMRVSMCPECVDECYKKGETGALEAMVEHELVRQYNKQELALRLRLRQWFSNGRRRQA